MFVRQAEKQNYIFIHTKQRAKLGIQCSFNSSTCFITFSFIAIITVHFPVLPFTTFHYIFITPFLQSAILEHLLPFITSITNGVFHLLEFFLFIPLLAGQLRWQHAIRTYGTQY